MKNHIRKTGVEGRAGEDGRMNARKKGCGREELEMVRKKEELKKKKRKSNMVD